jgi:hypothetical protein
MPKCFSKQDFRYVAEEDVYVCPAGDKLGYSFTMQEHGLMLRRYLTNATVARQGEDGAAHDARVRLNLRWYSDVRWRSATAL